MPKTITVSSMAELYDALSKATSGETILLTGGNYGAFNLSTKSKFDITFPSTVTIASADPENPAVFASMTLQGVENLTLDGITFDYAFKPGDPSWARPFNVLGSENITIRNSVFDGDLAEGVSAIDDGYGYGVGLLVRETTGIRVENNAFFDFHLGMTLSKSSDIAIIGNDIHSMRSDGMSFAAVTDIVIENNYIHDFRGSKASGDHMDMIQFSTKGTTTPSTNITIASNHLDIGNGTPNQSIFMRNVEVDSGQAGSEMFFQNVTITDNVIVNGHLHGITVGETAGLVISNNSVLHADGDNPDGADGGVEIPQIRVAATSTDVSITNNVTVAINGHTGQSGWSVKGNAFVQDQDSAAPGYYGDVFVASSLQMISGVHNFLARDGAMLDLLGAGAAATLTPAAFNLAAPVISFHAFPEENNGALYRFDAAAGAMDLASLPDGTTFLWNFGDGTTATGPQASHAFAGGGSFNVSLTVQLPGMTAATQTLNVDVAGPDVLSYAAGTGFIAYENGAEIALAPGANETGPGLDLGAKGVAATIGRNHVAGILGQDSFAINMTLAADTAGSAGEVMRLHSSFSVSVTTKGELSMQAFTTEGEIRLTTSGANLSNTEAHDIAISYNQGMLSASVNGAVMGSVAMPAALASIGEHNLVFGNPWGHQNFDGTLSALKITANADDFAGIAPITAADRLSIEVPIPEPVPEYTPEPIIEPVADIIAPVIDVLPVTPPAPIGMASLQILSYAAGTGFVARDQGIEIALAPGANETGTGLDLGGTGVAASVNRGHVIDILGQDSFAINMTLAADTAGSAGEVMRLHSSFFVTVTTKGECHVYAVTTQGPVQLTTKGANLTDMKAHDIGIVYEDGMLSVSVNGAAMDSVAMQAPLDDRGNHNLVFGNPWGGKNFDGTLSALQITAKTDDLAGTARILEPMIQAVTAAEQDLPPMAISGSVDVFETAFDAWGATDPQIPQERIDRFEALMIHAADGVVYSG